MENHNAKDILYFYPIIALQSIIKRKFVNTCQYKGMTDYLIHNQINLRFWANFSKQPTHQRAQTCWAI